MPDHLQQCGGVQQQQEGVQLAAAGVAHPRSPYCPRHRLQQQATDHVMAGQQVSCKGSVGLHEHTSCELVKRQVAGIEFADLCQADGDADGDVEAVVEQHEQHVVCVVAKGAAGRRCQQRPLPPLRPPA